jgi:peptidoglycan/xylan/chitin deacetylase (PgdA/CDA1 family)
MLGQLSKYVFLGRVQRTLCHSGLLILTYHRIGPPPDRAPDPFLYDTAGELDAHLTAVKQAGLRLAPFTEALSGDPIQPGTATVTFDDGCLCTLEKAVPVLARHKMRAIQYLVTGRIGGRNDWDLPKEDVPERLMDLGQIREWIAAGHDVGSHTITHRNLKTLSVPEAREEICGSKKMLESLLGVPVRHFCYPYGGWTMQSIRELVKEAGYRSACTTRFGVAQPDEDRWTLPRITPLPSWRLIEKAWHRARRKLQGV